MVTTETTRFADLPVGACFRLHELHGSVWIKFAALHQMIAGTPRERNSVCILSEDGANNVGDIGFFPPDVKINPTEVTFPLLKRQSQTLPSDGKPRFQLFVRWFRDHNDAGGTVELARNGEIILSELTCNNERVYGFCRAIVRLLRLSGFEAEMPMCLQGHLGPNRNKED